MATNCSPSNTHPDNVANSYEREAAIANLIEPESSANEPKTVYCSPSESDDNFSDKPLLLQSSQDPFEHRVDRKESPDKKKGRTYSGSIVRNLTASENNVSTVVQGLAIIDTNEGCIVTEAAPSEQPPVVKRPRPVISYPDSSHQEITPASHTISLDSAESNNEETYFALSLIGTLKRLDPRKRAIAKCNILSYLTELEYGSDAQL